MDESTNLHISSICLNEAVRTPVVACDDGRKKVKQDTTTLNMNNDSQYADQCTLLVLHAFQLALDISQIKSMLGLACSLQVVDN